MALCQGQLVWAGTRKVKLNRILLKQDTVSGSVISWAICKSAPRSKQITMPAHFIHEVTKSAYASDINQITGMPYS